MARRRRAEKRPRPHSPQTEMPTTAVTEREDATTKPALAKKQKVDIFPSSWDNFLEIYSQEDDERYNIVALWPDTPVEQLIFILKNQATFVGRTGLSDKTSPNAAITSLLCRKFGIPCEEISVSTNGLLLSGFTESGKSPVALCSTGIRSEHQRFFKELKIKTIGTEAVRFTVKDRGATRKLRGLMLEETRVADGSVVLGEADVKKVLVHSSCLLVIYKQQTWEEGSTMSEIVNLCAASNIPCGQISGYMFPTLDTIVACFRSAPETDDVVQSFIRAVDVHFLTSMTVLSKSRAVQILDLIAGGNDSIQDSDRVRKKVNGGTVVQELGSLDSKQGFGRYSENPSHDQSGDHGESTRSSNQLDLAPLTPTTEFAVASDAQGTILREQATETAILKGSNAQVVTTKIPDANLDIPKREADLQASACRLMEEYTNVSDEKFRMIRIWNSDSVGKLVLFFRSGVSFAIIRNCATSECGRRSFDCSCYVVLICRKLGIPYLRLEAAEPFESFRRKKQRDPPVALLANVAPPQFSQLVDDLRSTSVSRMLYDTCQLPLWNQVDDVFREVERFDNRERYIGYLVRGEQAVLALMDSEEMPSLVLATKDTDFLPKSMLIAVSCYLKCIPFVFVEKAFVRSVVDAEDDVIGLRRTSLVVEEKIASLLKNLDVSLLKTWKAKPKNTETMVEAVSVAMKTTTNVDEVCLEEKITALEAMVEVMTKRRSDTANALVATRKEIEESSEQIRQLQRKETEIITALQRQKQLEQELQDSLEKSELRLQKLQLPSYELSHEELSQLTNAGTMASETLGISSENLADDEVATSKSTDDSDTGGLACAQENSCIFKSRDLRDFWTSARDIDTRTAPFIPSLTPPLVEAVLEVGAAEIRSADSAAEGGWKARRQLMWNTCLDVRITSIRKRSNEAGTNHRALVSSVDPNVQLCPYELSGECQDDFCAFQHLAERRYGRILPRELLPLPPLAVASKREAATNESGTSHDTSTESLSAETREQEKGLDSQDFFRLPVLNSKEDNQSNSTAAGLNIALPKNGIDEAETSAETRCFPCWLSPESIVFNESPLSIDQLLAGAGVFADDPFGRPHQTSSQNASDPSLNKTCDRLCRVFDCVGIAVHAGRYDLANRVIGAARQSFSKVDTESVAGVVIPLVDLLDDLRSWHFAFEKSQGDSLFGLILSYQFMMGVYSLSLSKWSRSGENEAQSVSTFFTVLQAALASSQAIENSEDSSILSSMDASLRSLFSESGGCCFQSLGRLCGVGRSIRNTVAMMNDFAWVMENLLPSSFSLLTSLLESCPADCKFPLTFGGTYLLSNIHLGLLECLSYKAPTDADTDSMRAQLVAVHNGIDNSLRCLHRIVGATFVHVDLILAPIVAANIALSATLRMYNKAFSRLTSLLLDEPSREHFSILSFSELLFSQLIHLEATLPAVQSADVSSCHKSSLLPDEVVARHEIVSKLLSHRGIFPHHVTLFNDFNLVQMIGEDEDVFRSLQEFLSDLANDNQEISFSSRQNKFVHRRNRGNAYPGISTIPHCLLLAGSRLIDLTLANSAIHLLPPMFGVWFDRLEILDLSNNELATIPDSLMTISTLRSLIVSGNELVSLPGDHCLIQLEVLDLSYNALANVPASLRKCQELRVLKLDGNNQLDGGVWELASQLPNLTEFSCDPGTSRVVNHDQK